MKECIALPLQTLCHGIVKIYVCLCDWFGAQTLLDHIVIQI
jgi:hypothetical protein